MYCLNLFVLLFLVQFGNKYCIVLVLVDILSLVCSRCILVCRYFICKLVLSHIGLYFATAVCIFHYIVVCTVHCISCSKYLSWVAYTCSDHAVCTYLLLLAQALDTISCAVLIRVLVAFDYLYIYIFFKAILDKLCKYASYSDWLLIDKPLKLLVLDYFAQLLTRAAAIN